VASETLLKEIATGQGETLSQAARRFPSTRRGRPVTLGCLLRWVLEGARTADGRRVRLEAARVGGRWLTTAGAITRFVAAQTPDLDAPAAAPSPRSAGLRRRAAEAAGRELERAGA
jgi:hypothetical protein